MATINDLLFELERRVILFTPETKMPDESALGYRGDPNDVSAGETDGQFLLYHCPVSTRYAHQDINGNLVQEWVKTTKPNVWGPLGSGGEDSSTALANLPGGDASVYAGVSGGKAQLRPIEGGQNITVSTSDNVIIIDSSGGGSGIYDTALDPDLAMPEKVGGYPAGTDVSTLYGDSIVKMFDNLLFPTVDPTYINPNCNFGAVVSGGPQSLLQEVGTVINIDFTSTLNKGAINVSGNLQDYRSGDASMYFYSDPSSDTLLVDTVATGNSDNQLVNNFLVNEGDQSFVSYINYLEGPQPYDNKGEIYGTPLPAGDTSPLQTITFEGVYPYFATTVDIDTLTAQPLESVNSLSNIDVWLFKENYPTNPNRQTVRFPNNFGPVVTFQTWNTTTLQWQASPAAEWDLTSVQVNINGTNVSYRQYEYVSNSRGATQMRFIF